MALLLSPPPPPWWARTHTPGRLEAAAGPWSTADAPPSTLPELLAPVEYRSRRESAQWSIYRVLTRRYKSTPSGLITPEGKKSPKQLASYTNRTTVGQTVTSSPFLFKVVYCKRKVHCYTPKPCYRKKQFPKVRGCEMANKENELACAGNLPAKLHDSHTLLLNASDSGSAQTQGPSSKYSGFFSEVSQDHDTMAQVLFSRNLRLNVALTFWRRRSISELIAYLVRIQDLGVVVDCLPVLTSSLQEEKPYISVGCCVDLFPLVKSLLKSKYEENIQILKQQLSGLWEQENHLTLVPGYTGNIAKVICFQ
ncbi:Putative protein C15orf29 [Chelonia mydas]|uniref:Katanin p80 subunit C-terminal domain-containing protein n=1 Tax=Chelonia mydas TaxID=8469 RepID=M7AUW5_CHEMY|nr:Putative protein C15orf29 [Chelonia mydas]